MQLTQKEQGLLQDQLHHEEVCIQKYQSYAQQTQDPQLKQLFNDYANQEQQHYKTINQLLGNPNQASQQQASPKQQNQLQPQGIQNQQLDALLCNDMLMTEKYVSSAYDTTIFESASPQLRQQLQHIQQEEQQHGEGLFNYMQSNGMYQPQ